MTKSKKHIRSVRCPWCGKWKPKTKLDADNKLTCTCGHWTQYVRGAGLVCATGIGNISQKINWFKKASVPRRKATR